MIHVLLLSDARDREMALLLEGALSSAGHTASTVSLGQDSSITLPARTRQTAQMADYFLYLVSRHSEKAHWLRQLTPDSVAPLCAAGLRILLLVFDQGSPPPALAYLPGLYLLDDQTAPALVDSLVDSLDRVHDLPPEQVALLRSGLEDLEVFLETAQALAFAYTGLKSAWSELSARPGSAEEIQQAAQALFHRYASDASLRIHFDAHARLAQRIKEQTGEGGLAAEIMRMYYALESDWLEIGRSLSSGPQVQEILRQARIRAAAFFNLVYLVMTLQLLPYCEQYLHMHGLKQHREMPYPAGEPADPAHTRLSFLIAHLMGKEVE